MPEILDYGGYLLDFNLNVVIGGSAFFYPILMEHWTSEKIKEAEALIAHLGGNHALSLNLIPIIFRETGNPGFMLRLTKLR